MRAGGTRRPGPRCLMCCSAKARRNHSSAGGSISLSHIGTCSTPERERQGQKQRASGATGGAYGALLGLGLSRPGIKPGTETSSGTWRTDPRGSAASIPSSSPEHGAKLCVAAALPRPDAERHPRQPRGVRWDTGRPAPSRGDRRVRRRGRVHVPWSTPGSDGGAAEARGGGAACGEAPLRSLPLQALFAGCGHAGADCELGAQ